MTQSLVSGAVKEVVYFDGVCNLCNGFVLFVIRHEKSPILRFAALQSDAGQDACRRAGLESTDRSTVLFETDSVILQKSEAVLTIASYLRRPFSWLRFARVLPRSFRDFIYDAVARRRYGWFGKLETCAVPTPELAKRFM